MKNWNKMGAAEKREHFDRPFKSWTTKVLTAKKAVMEEKLSEAKHFLVAGMLEAGLKTVNEELARRN